MVGAADGLPEVWMIRRPETAPARAEAALVKVPTVRAFSSTFAMEFVTLVRSWVPP